MVRSVVKISTGPVRQSQGLPEFSAPELGHSKGLGGVRQVRVKPRQWKHNQGLTLDSGMDGDKGTKLGIRRESKQA